MMMEYPAPASPTPAKMMDVNIAKRFPQLSLPQQPQQSLFFNPRKTRAGKIIKTPDPSMPPKYHTSSVMFSLLEAGTPPGKNSKILHRTQRIASGMRVMPRHLAQLPEHMVPDCCGQTGVQKQSQKNNLKKPQKKKLQPLQ
uniref:Uncharacterized protein n=1 Tax=Anguilla anguilla TaxID=7936 RepID=A0A0E9XVS7_ANGAN